MRCKESTVDKLHDVWSAEDKMRQRQWALDKV